MYLGIVQAWSFCKGSFIFTKRAIPAGDSCKVAVAEPPLEKEKMAEVAERECVTRDRCSSAHHMASLIIVNHDIQFDCRIALFLVGPRAHAMSIECNS